MSLIGKKPVEIPGGVTVTLSGRTITAQGPKGTLTYEHRPEVSVTIDTDAKQVVVDNPGDVKQAKKYHGLTRSLVQNMVEGVSKGFVKNLEINGVGWNAQLQGRKLNLNLGYADTRTLEVPMGVEVVVEGNGKLAISGADKQAVGQFAASIRRQRPPEPYNGKGIKYAGEVIIRKEGKAFAGGGG
ncbi:MAG: 50S ribosomal protein L6 [Phycisphaera sp.]|nr:50S ribosomal protein L6 [Phycisphaera sp.]